MTLDLAIRSLDQLTNEVDTVIRAEFSEYNDRLDQVIMLLKTTDRTDVGRLTSQMGRLQVITESGSQCTCEAEARWHACLGRLTTAIEQAALRYNVESVKVFCEEQGLPHEEVMAAIEMLVPKYEYSPELPDLPDGITVPDNASDLTS